MTLSLDISNELEQQLSQEASRLGLPLEQYALQILSARAVQSPAPTNGAELVAYWQAANLIGSRPDITDTETFSRELRERTERRVLE